jgi:hypothetical protein
VDKIQVRCDSRNRLVSLPAHEVGDGRDGVVGLPSARMTWVRYLPTYLGTLCESLHLVVIARAITPVSAGSQKSNMRSGRSSPRPFLTGRREDCMKEGTSTALREEL